MTACELSIAPTVPLMVVSTGPNVSDTSMGAGAFNPKGPGLMYVGPQSADCTPDAQ